MFPLKSLSEVFLSWGEDEEDAEALSDSDHGDNDADEGEDSTPRYITEVEYREYVHWTIALPGHY